MKYEQTKSFGSQVSSKFFIFGNDLEYGEEFQLTFPCRFHLSKFPFDSHECSIYFGDGRYSTDELRFNVVTINDPINGLCYNESSVPLVLEDLALPFRIELEVLPTKEKDYGYNVFQTGILIRIKRESLGLLLSGYYYPTTSFAVLSMMSFLINPDVVIHSLTWSKINLFL